MIETTRDLSGLLWRRSEPVGDARGRRAVLAFLSPSTRIDNMDALRRTLGLAGEASVEQVLLEGWRVWGDELANRLRGAFAFAIFEPQRQILSLVRDISGLAPLFYVAAPNCLAVAATSRMARALFGQELSLDEVFHAEFLNSQSTTRGRTFFAGLSRLLPAHILEFSAASDGEMRRYWSPHDVPRDVPCDDAAARFRKLFDRSVLRSFHPGKTAVLLSGGMDSSAILGAVTANGIAPSEIPCLTKTYRGTRGWSDAHYLDVLRDHFDLELNEVPSDRHDPLEAIGEYLALLDGPYLSYGHSVTAKLQKVARARGWTTLLSGHGGDEVVGYGSGRLNELARAHRWLSVWRETAGVAQLSRDSRLRFMRNYLTHYPAYRPLERVIRKILPDTQTAGDPSLSDRAEDLVGAEQLTYVSLQSRRDHDERMLHLEALESPMQPLAIESIMQTSRAAGVVTEMPFYDRDLIEFSLSLPSHWKLRGGLTRFVLREAMRSRLPREVLERGTKYDFTAPFVAGLSDQREQVLDWTAGTHHLFRDLVNLDRLERVRHVLGRKGTELENDDARFIWRCTVLCMWLDQFDPTVPPPELVPLLEPA